MAESDTLRYTRIPLTHGAGAIPALGFGTLIPDPVVYMTHLIDSDLAVLMRQRNQLAARVFLRCPAFIRVNVRVIAA